MPDGLSDKLRQARAGRAMQGERRVITLLFCDVTGSTAMAEQLDAEEWAEIMNEAFQYMIAPIYTYEGTVARLMGDALLAFFGAPIAHEDDPQRAVLAGLDIVTGIERFTAEIREMYGMDFNVRVGINTGPVVVGEIGADLAIEYSALGDAVNLAARMEQTAVPGTVQIAEDTFHLVEPFFDITPLGPIEVKGKEQPVKAYRIDSLAAQQGSLRGLDGLTSPLVGRAGELAALHEAVETVRNGRGQVLFLVGEAGLGKSRLIDELHTHWLATRRPTEDGWTHWERTNAVSFASGRPYGMIKQQLRRAGSINDSDTRDQARGKLAHAVSIYPADLQARLNLLFAILLGLADEQPGLQPEGDDFRRELFEGMREANRLRAGGQPTLLVADDLHWGDPASVAELEHLLQLADENPILFIVVMRPEQASPAWAMKERAAARCGDRFTEIQLHPLSEEESADLVERLLPVEDMPEAVRRMILQRTDGNPFFIEEVIRALMDSGALQQDGHTLRWNPALGAAPITIPGNVQALLAARIDRLEKEARQTLQLASVIGRTFYRRVLDTISETGAALDEQLSELEALALIREAAHLPELEYTFRHALTRDAAYHTILRRRRRQFHRRVGEAIETLFPNRLEEEAHRLAGHFQEALVFDKAQHYYTMAGDHALRLSAKTEAIEHYTRALAITREHGSSEQCARLYGRLGHALEVSGRYDDELAMFQEMHEMAEARSLPTLELQALLAEATIRSTFTDKFHGPSGRRLSTQALALAQELGDKRAESKAYWNLLLLGTYTDHDVEKSLEYGERAVAIAREHDLREEMAYALHDLARPYLMAGRVKEGERALEEAAVLWRALGRSNMLADNRTTLAGNLNVQGDLTRGIALAREALEISLQSSNYWGQAYALVSMAPALLEIGHVDEAFAAWERGLEAAERANFTAPNSYALPHMALSYAQLGDFDKAFSLMFAAQEKSKDLILPAFANLPTYGLKHLYILSGDLEKAQQTAVQSDAPVELEPIIFSLVVTTQMILSLAREEYAQALTAADKALQLAGEGGLAFTLPELLHLKARALLGLERPADAARVLREAAARARSINARRMLVPVLALLMAVEERRGNGAAAVAAQEEGQAAAAYITAHIADPALRHKYAHTQPVSRLRRRH